MDPTTSGRNRVTILAEFTNQLSKESSGESLTIEWSSSDDEVIHLTHPSTSASETEVNASMKNDQYSEAYELLVPAVSDQNSSSININRKICPQKPDGKKALLNLSCQVKNHNTQGILPLSKHHNLNIRDDVIDTKETELLSSVSGRFHDEALSHPSASGINVLEPLSPILGSRIFVRAKKVQIKTSSDKFQSCKVPKRKQTLSDAVSVKRQAINDDTSVNWRFNAAVTASREEQKNLGSFHGHYVSNDISKCNERIGILNDVHEAEHNRCSQPKVGRNEGTRTPEKIHVSPGDCIEKHTLSECLIDNLSQEIIQLGSYGSQGNSKTSDTVLKPSVWSDLSMSQEHLEFDVDEFTSQSIPVPSDGKDSQLDCNIEASLTPCKNSMYGTAISEDSESPALQVASTTDLPGLDGNTRSGFDWVKNLQTPQKLLSSENNVDGMESAQKKLIKDGQAQQLKRMLMSWRSCITVLSHELSLTKLLDSSPGQSPMKVQHHTITTSDMVKLRSQEDIYEVKPICSLPVKNLQDLFMENPASSPGTSLWSCNRNVSRKYLDLRLIDVGGQLPSNAALCEAMGSNVEDFQTSWEIKEENSGAVGARKIKKFLVFFALNEHNITTLLKFDTVRVYATWQNLSVFSHDIPAIFTSYFKFHLKREELPSFSMGCRRTVLHNWTYNCSDKLTVASTSGGELCAFPWVSSAQVSNVLLPGVHSGFTTIKDTPDTPPQICKLRSGTILEALEKCGGVSAVPVSITIKIQRTIIRREPSGSLEFWEILGQDAVGQFCIVKMPKLPLAQHLIEALSDSTGNHSTHTLTHLMMTQRLTNTQNPGLFSLITSLHNGYQRSLSGNPILQPALQELVPSPPQTHCYVLTVSLGVTSVTSSGEQVTFPIMLPNWSLQEALAMSHDGQRGSLTVYVLYKTCSSLHIVSPSSHQEGCPTMFCVGKETEETEPGEILLISRVLLMGVALPCRWPESGPVMLPTVLKDAVLWHGSIVVDEYSFIEVQEEGSTKIDLAVLNQALSPLSGLTRQDSLTLVSGTIIKIEEENAFIYLICGNCKSDKVEEAGDGHINCAVCGQKSTLPSRGYFLEVWLDCGPDLQQTYVKVKLYQKTIKKLLQAYCGPQEEKYSATSLLGHQIGPMACVLLQIQRPRHCSICTYNLAELPF